MFKFIAENYPKEYMLHLFKDKDFAYSETSLLYYEANKHYIEIKM